MSGVLGDPNKVVSARYRLGALTVALICASCTDSGRAPTSSAPSSTETSSPQADETSVGSVQADQGRSSLGPADKLRPSEWIRGPKRSSFVVLTGAASPEAIRKVIADLAETPAAFFIPGRYLQRHQKLITEIAEAGFTLGNYGWDGKPLTRSGSKAARRSIRRTEKVLAASGVDPRPFLLAPKGLRGKRVLRIAGKLGYRSVRPTVTPEPHEGEGKSPRKVARSLMRDLRPGSILQLRLARRSHRRAVAEIVDRLERTDLEPSRLARLEDVRPVHWDVTLAGGAKGWRVEALQRALAAATYPAGEPDGVFGVATIQAVLAFEKVHGLSRDGVVDPEQMEAILVAEPPEAPSGSGSHYIDIDLTRQVLFEVRNGEVVNTYPVSTANGETYETQGGGLATARTPRGSYRVQRKIPGWRVSYLGQLYFPVYFYGGYAIHGSPSVPAYPASHGCVRIPMHVAEDFYSATATGVPISVHD